MDKGTNNHLQNITQKTKGRATHPTTINGVNSGVRPVALCTNPDINHECGKDRIMITTQGTYPCSFVTQIPCNE